MADHHPLLLGLEDALSANRPRVHEHTPEARRTPPSDAPKLASVALVVRPGRGDLELLVIRRATHEGDPWSGHMAFPGGRREPSDRDARETAERETREEVGIDLASSGRLLGRLDDVGPRAAPISIVISPFVFAVDGPATVSPNYEVEAAYWIPVGAIAAPGAATEYLHTLAHGEELPMPAIAFQSHVIWGLTHGIMLDFLRFVPGPSGDG